MRSKRHHSRVGQQRCEAGIRGQLGQHRAAEYSVHADLSGFDIIEGQSLFADTRVRPIRPNENIHNSRGTVLKVYQDAC